MIDHLNLTVGNFDESVEWYRRIFGFRLVERGRSPDGLWGIIRRGDSMLCLYERPERVFLDRDQLRERGVHGINHFGLRIADEAAWRETLRREGIVPEFELRYPHSRS